MWRWTLVVGLVVLIAVPASAFDGKRKGFVLGGGLGAAPNASWDADPAFTSGLPENHVGLGANFLIGYAWDEFNMIVAEGNGAAFKTDYRDADAFQGFGGVAFYHYFGPCGAAFFGTIGVGSYAFDWETEGGGSGSLDPGFGLLMGAGYEFTRHVQGGAYFGYGKTSEPYIDYTHWHVNILVSAVAF